MIQVNRLQEVDVEPGSMGPGPILLPSVASYCYQKRPVEDLVLPYAPSNLAAVHVRHSDVQKYDFGQELQGRGKGEKGVLQHPHLVTPGAEHRGKNLKRIQVVVYDEHTHNATSRIPQNTA